MSRWCGGSLPHHQIAHAGPHHTQPNARHEPARPCPPALLTLPGQGLLKPSHVELGQPRTLGQVRDVQPVARVDLRAPGQEGVGVEVAGLEPGPEVGEGIDGGGLDGGRGADGRAASITGTVLTVNPRVIPLYTAAGFA